MNPEQIDPEELRLLRRLALAADEDYLKSPRTTEALDNLKAFRKAKGLPLWPEPKPEDIPRAR